MRLTYNQRAAAFFEDYEKKKVFREKIINEICSETCLRDTLDYLRKKHSSHLNISHSDLKKELVPVLERIISDLKDYKQLTESNVEPVNIKKQFLQIKSKLESVDNILMENQLLTKMINHILQEGEFEHEEPGKRLSLEEAKNLFNSEIKPSGTMGIFRNNTSTILKTIELLSTELSSERIWAFRLHHLPIEQQALFYYSYNIKNKLLFVVAFHLDGLAENLKLKATNGKSVFIEMLCIPISEHIGKYFKSLGSLSVDDKDIRDLFRSKSWESLHKK